MKQNGICASPLGRPEYSEIYANFRALFDFWNFHVIHRLNATLDYGRYLEMQICFTMPADQFKCNLLQVYCATDESSECTLYG